MNLLIDVGNTNLRWACHGDGVHWEVKVLRHNGGMPLDLLAAWEGLAAPARILVSHVGSSVMADALGRVARAYWGIEPNFARTRSEFAGVRIAYADPARFGVDRWLTLIAAHAESPQPTLVLDAGTAATFDLLLADGQHLGGLILPGVEMMRTSLLAGTHIPRVTDEPAGDPWATDTGTAVAAGSVQALGALADRLFDRLAEQSGAQPRLLLTGGDAERLRPALGRPCQEVPDLVMRGLVRLAGCGKE